MQKFSQQLVSSDPVLTCGVLDATWKMANKIVYLCFTYIIIVIQLDVTDLADVKTASPLPFFPAQKENQTSS